MVVKSKSLNVLKLLKICLIPAIILIVFLMFTGEAKAEYAEYSVVITNKGDLCGYNITPLTEWHGMADNDSYDENTGLYYGTNGSAETAYWRSGEHTHKLSNPGPGCGFSYGPENSLSTWVSGNFYNGTPYLWVNFDNYEYIGNYKLVAIRDRESGNEKTPSYSPRTSAFMIDVGMYGGDWKNNGYAYKRDSGTTIYLDVYWEKIASNQTVKIYLQDANGNYKYAKTVTKSVSIGTNYNPYELYSGYITGSNAAIYANPYSTTNYLQHTVTKSDWSKDIYIPRRQYTQTVNYIVEDATDVSYTDEGQVGTVKTTKVPKTVNVYYGATWNPLTNASTKYTIPEGHSINASASSSNYNKNITVTKANTIDVRVQADKYNCTITDFVKSGNEGEESYVKAPINVHNPTYSNPVTYENSFYYGSKVYGSYKDRLTGPPKDIRNYADSTYSVFDYKYDKQSYIVIGTDNSKNTASRYYSMDLSPQIDGSIYHSGTTKPPLIQTFARADDAVLEIHMAGYITKLNITFEDVFNEADESLSTTINLDPTKVLDSYNYNFVIPYSSDFEEGKTYYVTVTGTDINGVQVSCTPGLIIEGSSAHVVKQYNTFKFDASGQGLGNIFRDKILDQYKDD